MPWNSGEVGGGSDAKQEMAMTYQLDCHGMTDVGLVRKANEDQFLIAELGKSMLIRQSTLSLDHQGRLFGNTQGYLFIVADGMGGHAAGARASGVAASAMAHYLLNTMPWFFRLDEKYEDDLRDELRAAIERCQAIVQSDSEGRLDRLGMGTTMTMAYVLWPRLYVVHVGDTRCYLFRNGTLRRITRDHTVAQQLIDEGSLPADEAGASEWSHVLWNTIGGASTELDPEVYKLGLEAGDTLLLCTDGLTRHVTDSDMAQSASECRSAKELCATLIELANSAGGSDNTTIVSARFVAQTT